MIIQIPQPCEQPWEEMKQTDKDCRFCASCQKTVTDFTGWTDNDIYHFYTKHPHACGQFTVSQLGRELLPYYPLPQRGWSFRGWALAAGLLFASAPLAWANPQGTEMVVDAEDTTRFAIKGWVFDEKGQPAVGAVVQLSEEGIVRYGVQILDGQKGAFVLRDVKPGNYNIKVSFVGYKDYIGEVLVKEDAVDVGKVILSIDPDWKPESAYIRSGRPSIEKDKKESRNIIRGGMRRKP